LVESDDTSSVIDSRSNTSLEESRAVSKTRGGITEMRLLIPDRKTSVNTISLINGKPELMTKSNHEGSFNWVHKNGWFRLPIIEVSVR